MYGKYGKSMKYMNTIRTISKHFIFAFLITFFIASPMVQARGYEDLSADQLERMGIYFVKGDFTCGANTTATGAGTTAGAGNQTLNLTATQVANAKIVIGIAKTYNLGKKGALIGVMTAITESHLRAYANTGVPVSQQNPAWQNLPSADRKSGHDHDSVGMFQQRVSTGWSTYGNLVTNAEQASTDQNAKNITWQLMDPAYNAQAFFGTPPGAKISNVKQATALTKGLQNVKDWQGRDPWIDSQEVQVSFDSSGSNYKENLPEAQKIIDTYYDDAPAVPLPIPVNGGSAPQPTTPATNANGCPDDSPLSGSGVQKMMQTIAKYAWVDYCSAHTSGCKGRDPACAAANNYCGTSNEMRKAYVDAVQAAKKKGDYFGDCKGVDCGGFVTRVMRDSGADPEYNKYQGNTLAQKQYLQDYSDDQHLSDKPVRYHHIKDSEKLQSGDIAVQNNADTHHTFIYVGKIMGTDLAGKPVPFNGVVASASQCGRAPMASSLPSRGDFEWYRLLK
jgi:hypothetical protein